MSHKFPSRGYCGQNKSHQIVIRRAHNKSYIPNEHCNKCSSPFNRIYFGGTLISAHYYECKECQSKICFNCALSTNKCVWSVGQLPRPTQKSFTRPPKINKKWLNVNNALDNMERSDLKKTMKEVIKSMGGLKNTLFFITKNMSRSQLDDVHNFVMEQKCADNKCDGKLESMPSELLSYTLSFLNKSEISTFKMCSRKIAHICLDELKNFFVTIADGNEMLLCDGVNPHNFDLFLSERRYNPKKLVDTIVDEWQNEVYIPPGWPEQEEYQVMMFRNKHSSFEWASSPWDDLDPTALAKETFVSRGERAEDWKKTLILGVDKVVMFNKDKERHTSSDKYWRNLIILQYFDIARQKLYVVQFFLCNAHDEITPDDILDEVLTKFPDIDGVWDGWYDEMIGILKQMDADANEPMLCLYQGLDRLDMGRGWGNRIQFGRKCSPRFTVQINDQHPYFIANKSKMINDDKAATNLPKFAERFQTYRVSFNDRATLRTCLQKYFDKRLCENEQRVFQPSIDVIFDFINAKYTQIEVFDIPPNEHTRYLKQKIVQKLDNIVKSEQIHIQYSGGKWSGMPSGEWTTGCRIILPYLKKINGPTAMYKIQIFLPKDCPYPYQNGKNGTKIVLFKYRSECSEQLITDLFETMANATDHIFYESYKELVDIYYKNGIEKNENIECIATHGGVRGSDWSNQWIKNHVRVNTEDFGGNSLHEINLYMTNIPQRSDFNSIKLDIKFVYCDYHLKAHNFVFVGLPLTVWINEWDTVQTVIDLHLKKIKKYILKSYRIRALNDNEMDVFVKRLRMDVDYNEWKFEEDTKGKTISIPKYKWANYRIAQKMKLPKDCIVFRVCERKKEEHITIPKLDYDDSRKSDYERAMEIDPYYYVVPNAILSYKNEKVVIKEVDNLLNNVCSLRYLHQDKVEENVALSMIVHVLKDEPGTRCKIVWGSNRGYVGTLEKIDGDKALVKTLDCYVDSYSKEVVVAYADPYYFMVLGALLSYNDEKVVVTGLEREECWLKYLDRDEEAQDVPFSDIVHTVSTDLDKCKIVHGKNYGKIGTLIRIDGEKAAMQLPEITEVTIIPKKFIVSYVEP